MTLTSTAFLGTFAWAACVVVGATQACAMGDLTCDGRASTAEESFADEVGLLTVRMLSKVQLQNCPNACRLPCDSGSCTNYLINADSMTECNEISNSMNCGDCKTSLPDGIANYANQYGASYATLCPSSTACLPCEVNVCLEGWTPCTIESVHAPGMYMNADDYNPNGIGVPNGANIRLWGTPQSNLSQWLISRTPPDPSWPEDPSVGGWTIENFNARGKYANVATVDWATNYRFNGANVQLLAPTSLVYGIQSSSQWDMVEVAGNSNVYTIMNRNASRGSGYMNVDGDGTNNGANIQIWDNPTSTSSQWRIVPLTDTAAA